MAQSFVVVGAYGGVGEALCRRLARRGARVLMAGRDPGKLALLAADHGGSVVLVSSAAARIGLANHEAIAAARAGIEGLALSASAIDWLLDTEQAWVTGQVLGVDGGLSRVRSRA